jgi:hypothetical protein
MFVSGLTFPAYCDRASFPRGEAVKVSLSSLVAQLRACLKNDISDSDREKLQGFNCLA